ncbi:hypothetical protein EBB07_03900 [Paenibacillaceae bacterium]|nr:hypothetical protein EBB07_03900 [Paenibacillaceae bacterium]
MRAGAGTAHRGRGRSALARAPLTGARQLLRELRSPGARRIRAGAGDSRFRSAPVTIDWTNPAKRHDFHKF